MDSGWIGQPISKATIAKVMGITLVASITIQVGPLILASMAQSGRIAVGEIGKVATAEFATSGLVTLAAVARLSYDRVRWTALTAALLVMTANLLTIVAPNMISLLAIRLCCGAASGILMWVLIGMSVRSTLTARIKGIYFALQGAASLAMAALFGSIVLPRLGADGAYMVLAGLALFAALAAVGLPQLFDPPRLASGASGGLPIRGWVALFAIGLSQAGVLAAWVHIPPLAAQHHFPPATLRFAVPVAIGMQIASGIIAAAIAARIRWQSILWPGLPAIAALALILSVATTPVLYITSAAALGFAWMLVAAFQYPLTLAVDSSRRTMAFVSPVQVIGAGLGPAIASLGVRGTDVQGAFIIAAAMMIAALAVLVATTSRRGMPNPLIGPTQAKPTS